MTQTAGGTGRAHDATVAAVDGDSPRKGPKLEQLQREASFADDQVKRMERKVARARDDVKAAEAALADAKDEQRAAEGALRAFEEGNA